MNPNTISDAELEVMKILWQSHPRSSSDIIKALAFHQWSDTTVKTLLARLVKKGVLATTAEGNRFFYTPRLTQEDYGVEKGQEIARLFSGSSTLPVMLQFIRSANLSPNDVEEIKKMLGEINHE